MLAIVMFVLLWLGWLAIWYAAAFRLASSEREQRKALRTIALPSGPHRWPQIAGMVLIIVSLIGILPDLQLWLSEGFAWLMLAVQLTGLIFAAWAHLHRADTIAQRVTFNASEDIIRSGPFGIVRHPVMAGLVLALIATILAAGKLGAMLGAALLIRGLVLQARDEETALAKHFRPGAYSLYKRGVPMLVPARLQPPDWLTARVVAVSTGAINRTIALIGKERLERLAQLAERHVAQPARRIARRFKARKRGDDVS